MQGIACQANDCCGEHDLNEDALITTCEKVACKERIEEYRSQANRYFCLNPWQPKWYHPYEKRQYACILSNDLEAVEGFIKTNGKE